MVSHYDVLGVPADSSPDEIKRSYRNLALQWHPDKNTEDDEAAEKFKEISDAYSVLSDVESRAEYDKSLRLPHPHLEAEWEVHSFAPDFIVPFHDPFQAIHQMLNEHLRPLRSDTFFSLGATPPHRRGFHEAFFDLDDFFGPPRHRRRRQGTRDTFDDFFKQFREFTRFF